MSLVPFLMAGTVEGVGSLALVLVLAAFLELATATGGSLAQSQLKGPKEQCRHFEGSRGMVPFLPSCQLTLTILV